MKSAQMKFPWFLFIATALLLGADLYLSLTNPLTSVAIKLGFGKNLVRFIFSISFTGPIFASFFFGAWSCILLFKKPEFRLFTKSIFTLTSVLMLGVILGVIRSHFFFADTYGWYRMFTIIINYVYTFGYLLGFGLLLFSTKKLLQEDTIWSPVISFFIALLIGTLYSVVLLTNPDRTVTSIVDIKPSLFLSDPLIIFTIILPTLLGWILAIWATFRLADAYGMLADPIRQQGLKQLLYGVFFIVFSAIMLQAILSIGTTRFIVSGLSFILGALYLFVAVLAIGNFFVLKGSIKLSQVT